MLRLLRQISFRQLRASWGRTILVIGGIAIGVSLIVAINIINTTIVENFQRTIEVIAGPADLEVVLGVGEVGFGESTVDAVRADPDVEAAVPLVRGTIALADDPGETLQLFGVDLLAEDDLQRYPITTAHRQEVLEGLFDAKSILLTASFAAERGVGLGEQLQLSTPEGVHDFTVRGLLETKGAARAFGGRLAVMDLPAGQLVLGKEGLIDQVDVVLRDGVDTEAARQRLEAGLPKSLTVGRPAQRGEHYERILASFQAMLTGLSLLCLVAGIYIVYNTTSTGATHRAMAFVGLRLIGATSSQLFRLLMLEALVLGAIGVLVGLANGVVLARTLIGMVADSMSVIFQLQFPVGALSLETWQQGVIAALGIAATLFASYFAARRVTELEPLDVMRTDLRSLIAVKASSRLIMGWFFLVAISAAALFVQVQLKSITWGNVGSTLWFASSIVIAIPLVSGSAVILSRVLPRLFGAEGRVAAQSLFHAPRRTGVTVAAIALVLTVAITSASLVTSLSRSISTYFAGGFLQCDLAVSAVTTNGGWLETPLPDDLATELLKIPGVRSVDLIRILPGHVYQGERVAVGGGSEGIFNPERYPSGWYRGGNPVEAAAMLRAGVGANVSVSLADRFNLDVGDPLELNTPSGLLTLRIAGIVPDYMSDRGSIILNRRLLVQHWHDRSVNRFHLFLEPGIAVEAVRARIRERLGSKYMLKLLSPREVVAFHAAQVDRAFLLMDAIQLLIVFVTVAGILDLLLSAVVERRRELSLWRVIGASEGVVRRSVVIEAATIGFMGVVLGSVLGFITGWIWVGMNFRYLLGYQLDYYFAGQAAAWFAAVVILMTILAGYGAAYSATRQSVLDGLRVD